MKHSIKYSMIIGVLICQLNCSFSGPSQSTQPKEMVHGVSFVAPPSPYPDDAFDILSLHHVNYIAVIPYAFMKAGEPKVHYNPDGKQWWGERPEGVKKSIEDAHAHNIDVMLKPSVYMWKSWTGDVSFESADDMNEWYTSYSKYLLSFAEMAESLGVRLFCIGNEFKQLTLNHPEKWSELISKVRSIYTGKLVYASNWDEYDKITFWDQLDYIGVNAYFPLSEKSTPSKTALLNAWAPIADQLKKVSAEFDRPILFTEYGYMSVDKAAHETWNLEKDRSILSKNAELQATCYEALFETFYPEPYWHGGFTWKWYPYEGRRMNFREKDYTPQGKVGAQVLKKWFAKK